MGEVGVHLDDPLGAAGERAAEAGDVGGAEALLAVADGGRRCRSSAAASRSAISPVPSGEASSTTRMPVPSGSGVEHARRRSPRGCRPRCRSAGRPGSASLRGLGGRHHSGTLTLPLPHAQRRDRRRLPRARDALRARRRQPLPRPRLPDAARAIADSPAPVGEMALEGRATELQGIGDTIQEKIVALLEQGEIPAAVKLKQKFPATLVEITRIPGVGAKTVRRIYDETGIATTEELRAAAEAGAAARPAGPRREVRGERHRRPRPDGRRGHRGAATAQRRPRGRQRAGRRAARRATPPRRSCSPARPGAGPTPARTSTSSPPRPTRSRSPRELAAHPLIDESGNPSENGLRARTHNGIALDLRIVPPDEFGNLLQHFTGSKEHNVKLRERAVKMGLSVSEHGIADTESGEVTRCEDEAGVYERLGLAYIEPELREGRDEIKLAAERRAARARHRRRHPRRPALPHDALRRQEHARGDGRGGPRARLLLPGDHRPLRHPRLRRRRPGRRSCSSGSRRSPPSTPSTGRAGSGCSPAREVNILPDGSLDYADEVLERARLGRRQRPHLVPDLEAPR